MSRRIDFFVPTGILSDALFLAIGLIACAGVAWWMGTGPQPPQWILNRLISSFSDAPAAELGLGHTMELGAAENGGGRNTLYQISSTRPPIQHQRRFESAFGHWESVIGHWLEHRTRQYHKLIGIGVLVVIALPKAEAGPQVAFSAISLLPVSYMSNLFQRRLESRR